MDPNTERVLLNPSELGVASTEAPAAIGPSVTLGNAASAPVAFYLRFEKAWRPGSVRAAFLLLEPSRGAMVGPDLELEVWRANRAWKGPGFTWSRQPGVSHPVSRGIARSAPPMPVRIDVTELVRFASEHPQMDHGYVLRASSERGSGVTVSTGFGEGVPPRLDVYVTPRPQTANPRARE